MFRSSLRILRLEPACGDPLPALPALEALEARLLPAPVALAGLRFGAAASPGLAATLAQPSAATMQAETNLFAVAITLFESAYVSKVVRSSGGPAGPIPTMNATRAVVPFLGLAIPGFTHTAQTAKLSGGGDSQTNSGNDDDSLGDAQEQDSQSNAAPVVSGDLALIVSPDEALVR
jgi:hypothetical protein